MQFKSEFKRKSEEEYIKEQGLIIDYDEIARKGKMSKEEALISKWYGVYTSKKTGDHMARIIVPGGKISSVQARKIADVSQKYSKGLLSITTRQAIQLHFLKIEIIAELMRDILEEGLSTFHGCGDVVRTISCCPLAEKCEFKRFDVRNYAISTMEYLTSCRDLDNLPRKLKVTFSGCSGNCAQPYMNCIGVIAVTRIKEGINQDGFRIVIGGGMGWKAFVAKDFIGFVPKNKIKEVIKAIADLYRDYGDRFNRSTSRLKFVVKNLGIERCSEIVKENLMNVNINIDDIVFEDVEKVINNIPKRPLTQDNPKDKEGLYTMRILIPKGEISSDKFKEIAKLSEIYGNQNVYTNNRQNIEIQGVEEKNLDKLKTKVEKLGFKAEGNFGFGDIVSCVGKTYCPKAVTYTRDLFDKIYPLVWHRKYERIRNRGFINITGCPNSCSPYRISDIGFRGCRIREEKGSVEGYEVLIGGSQYEHGSKLGEYKINDCKKVTEKILDLFLNELNENEEIEEFVKRKGINSIKEFVENGL